MKLAELQIRIAKREDLIIRLIKQATGNDIGIDIRDFEVLLTIPRQKVSRLTAI